MSNECFLQICSENCAVKCSARCALECPRYHGVVMATDSDKQRGVAVIEKEKTERPRLYKVLFHNDDYTSMEFVIDTLMRFFRHDQAQVLDYARANDYPLRVTTEPE